MLMGTSVHAVHNTGGSTMASRKQVAAAKRNVVKAQEAARRKRTIAHLPAETRRDMVAEAQKGRRRGGRPGHALEDRNRQQLNDVARDLGIRGRSKMGKAELIRAIRDARGA
jgi:DNA end-binding protein Ku